MTCPDNNPRRRPADERALSLSVGIIAAFAVAIVLGLAFWTMNDRDRTTAFNAATGTGSGITTGIAPAEK